ncbi:hypothetical protein THAOC_14082 [Thalassiosira oceanica]|uniref:Uncharacterized protein n=1 Tax=Thalassiosira oceanica TaxID=159749 RepID=K0SG60_THAOC|nr:hypothetical protein THAOC_14082 [Thalassiosira oceanica]|eukprot:EJK65108.1 hypothetical protein THAOC_14082 [Thalassiosira oceanica]
MDRKGRRGRGPVLAADKEVSHETLSGGGGRTHLRSASRRRNGGPCGRRQVAATPPAPISVAVGTIPTLALAATARHGAAGVRGTKFGECGGQKFDPNNQTIETG